LHYEKKVICLWVCDQVKHFGKGFVGKKKEGTRGGASVHLSGREFRKRVKESRGGLWGRDPADGKILEQRLDLSENFSQSKENISHSLVSKKDMGGGKSLDQKKEASVRPKGVVRSSGSDRFLSSTNSIFLQKIREREEEK